MEVSAGEKKEDGPMTSGVLWHLGWKGEGVAGLVLEVGVGLGLTFGREGEGEDDVGLLEKKEVIWLC